jgi:hypothetical protein
MSNIVPINIGSAPDDHTGDAFRDGGIKINNNFAELKTFGPVRHRQALLEYSKDAIGAPDFLTSVGLVVSLQGKLVGSMMAGVDDRTERNVMINTPVGVSDAWTLPDNAVNHLYIEVNPVTSMLTFGHTTASYSDSYQQPSSPSIGDHWVDRAGYRIAEYSAIGWVPVYRLFVARVTTAGGNVSAVEHFVGNEELSLAVNTLTPAIQAAQAAANQAKIFAIVFG